MFFDNPPHNVLKTNPVDHRPWSYWRLSPVRLILLCAKQFSTQFCHSTEFLKTDQYALTVMARSAEQIDVLSKLGVKTIQAGVHDLEKIASAIEAHDVIFSELICATAAIFM